MGLLAPVILLHKVAPAADGGAAAAPADAQSPGRPTRDVRLSPEIVAAAQAGDVGAQAEFFRQAWPVVHGLVYRLLGADGEAADVAQDVFVQALGGLQSLRDPHAWSFWLRGIAIRVVRRKLRTRRLLRRLGLYHSRPAEDFELVAASGVPADVAAQMQELRVLLSELSDEVRLLISLRYLEELSLPEIAAHLGLSLSTVKRRYQVARDALERRCTPRMRTMLLQQFSHDGVEL